MCLQTEHRSDSVEAYVYAVYTDSGEVDSDDELASDNAAKGRLNSGDSSSEDSSSDKDTTSVICMAGWPFFSGTSEGGLFGLGVALRRTNETAVRDSCWKPSGMAGTETCGRASAFMGKETQKGRSGWCQETSYGWQTAPWRSISRHSHGLEDGNDAAVLSPTGSP